MKLLSKYLLIFTTLLLAGNSLAEEVVATVNGEKITKFQLEQHIKLLESMTKQKVDDQAAALNDLIDREIIHQEVKRKKIDQNPELVYIAEFQTRELFSKALFKQSEIGEPVTDAEIKKLYDEKIKTLDLKEFKISHILIKGSEPDGESKAKAIIAELDKGTKFEELAKSKSQDPSASKGGDIGWLNLAQLRGLPQIAQAISEMSKGSYSKTPVKSNAGWHVLKLVDTRKQEPPTLEDTKKRLTQVIRQQRLQSYLEKLRNKAKVEVKLK
ncbi:MAG: peptidylprolyl isomerase [Thioalkalispiraceae bacterium]|jgi:peptidyl-prolyl cis-trans isomerase C